MHFTEIRKKQNKTKPKKPDFNTCSPLDAREGTQFWIAPTWGEEGEGTGGKGEGKTWRKPEESASAAGSSGWGNASMAEVRHEEHLILSMAIHFLTV